MVELYQKQQKNNHFSVNLLVCFVFTQECGVYKGKPPFVIIKIIKLGTACEQVKCLRKNHLSSCN